ncbi:Protein phosphatase 1H [Holothuria leucospilota]|uniref:Protein phosphatase 1H n=1 Tax=Holothuria leucospilota TaxID=206669 RepID=A0A9Q1CJP8_HOLLE|nr:Protein phosphatase 1H [Holothuria leucospilota]
MRSHFYKVWKFDLESDNIQEDVELGPDKDRIFHEYMYITINLWVQILPNIIHSFCNRALKRITEEDLKFPLIFGEGKRARVLATIGVTRGFGDHELKVCGTDIRIKPFLSPAPEVKVYNLFEYDHSENDVLIMGTDGLWDVLSNERAAAVVNEVLESFPANDYKRYASAAQELVMAARGVLREKGWRIHEDKPGSGDDITVFVIPLSRHQNMSRENSFTESREVSPSDGPSE